jgi:hypothetical protein
VAAASGAVVDFADDSTPESDVGTCAAGFGASPLIDVGGFAGTLAAEDVGGSRCFPAADILG